MVRRTRSARQGVALFAVAALLSLAGACDDTSRATRAWDDEVTGVIAQANDIVALQMVPALATEPAGAYDGQPAYKTGTPDIAALQPACRELGDVPADLTDLASTAPSDRNEAAVTLQRLAAAFEKAAATCVATIDGGDATLRNGSRGMSDAFSSAGQLETTLATQLHDGTKCPVRLRSTVETCKLAS